MKKLLLIEDDAVMRGNTSEILELAGYQVSIAANGKTGAQLAKTLKPDLIVCDIMMPELDGYGVLHVLSRDPVTAGIPFIFLTAKSEKSEMRKGMEMGADDYLTKPFEETELLNAVETRLRKREAMHKEFARTIDGLNQFLEEAKGLAKLDTLSQTRNIVRYRKKEAIYREGDTPQHLFFLSQGKVKVQKLHDEGKEYIVELRTAGEFFGYIPLLRDVPYEDEALAFEDCEICKIPKEEFLGLLQKDRDVAAKFISLLSNNLGTMEKQLLSLAYDTVRKRVATALLMLVKRNRDAGKTTTRLTVSRDDLAGMAGTAAETVIRSLGEFKADKLIEVQGREIVILDSEGLEAIQ